MKNEFIDQNSDIVGSPLYSADLAPVPHGARTWNKWNLAALWVGMAVCIPTYILASYMIKSGLSWVEALMIIGLANLVITVPMVLNGDAGVRYGVPFPVLGRATFGIHGIHIPSLIRAIVACGWFGVQTWVGGLACYSIWNAVTGAEGSQGLSIGKFVAFGVFWFVNMYFIWKGTESIKWLEDYSAPILIIIGLILIVWGWKTAGGFGIVLQQGEQLQRPTTRLFDSPEGLMLSVQALNNVDATPKAHELQIAVPTVASGGTGLSAWIPLSKMPIALATLGVAGIDTARLRSGELFLKVQIRASKAERGQYYVSSPMTTAIEKQQVVQEVLWQYVLWFTAMVGFWATMSLSIADITRYAISQKAQLTGQFIGLPGTMMFYSFVGIFVTCAAVVSFPDVLTAEDAPWDPVSLVAKFQNPLVVIFAQIAMIIATLSTNIAANVIAPANVFSNLAPKLVSFRAGGIITGMIGIIICPWWLFDEISTALIFISGLLGPVLGIMLADYYVIRKKHLVVHELYNPTGIYRYYGGFNPAAMIAIVVGVTCAVIGRWVPAFAPLYSLSWFTGFAVAFALYVVVQKKSR